MAGGIKALVFLLGVLSQVLYMLWVTVYLFIITLYSCMNGSIAYTDVELREIVLLNKIYVFYDSNKHSYFNFLFEICRYKNLHKSTNVQSNKIFFLIVSFTGIRYCSSGSHLQYLLNSNSNSMHCSWLLFVLYNQH